MSVFKNWGEKEVVAWRAQQNIHSAQLPGRGVEQVRCAGVGL